VKLNNSIHRAALYLINIIKIFIQSSLLSKEDSNLIYTIISQSATSPFPKRAQFGAVEGVDSSNTTSKDNSDRSTPRFAGDKNEEPASDDPFVVTGKAIVAAKQIIDKISKYILLICRCCE
jgi:hypothetical protein